MDYYDNLEHNSGDLAVIFESHGELTEATCHYKIVSGRG